jgi:hypothetical protein
LFPARFAAPPESNCSRSLLGFGSWSQRLAPGKRLEFRLQAGDHSPTVHCLKTKQFLILLLLDSFLSHYYLDPLPKSTLRAMAKLLISGGRWPTFYPHFANLSQRFGKMRKRVLDSGCASNGTGIENERGVKRE